MKIKELKNVARNALRNRWGFAVLSTLIIIVISSIPTIVEVLWGGNFLNNEQPSATSQIVSWIFRIALFPIVYGFNITFLDMIRDEQVTLKQLFQGFKENKYFKIIGVYFLTLIYTFLWFIVLIIPGIIKSIAYSQAYFILKDNPEISPNAAIAKSQELMKGYKWKYFLLQLSFIGWGLLATLTVGIGFLWLAPYISASTAAFYQSLIKEDKEEDKGTGSSTQL